MTNIHVWTPLRYKFEGLLEYLQAHPRLQNGQVKSLKIHYRCELTNENLYDICTVALNERNQTSVHILVYDDDEVEEGCGLETLDIFIKHLINLTRLHTQTYFMFADLIDYLYLDATYSARELSNFKRNTSEIISGSASKNFYYDFRGSIDGADCDHYNNPTEEGMRKLFVQFGSVLTEQAPRGAFR